MKIFYSVKSMCCAALLVLTFTVSAKSVELGFHIGKIMAAEITAQPQEVINLESYPYACKFSKTLYAVVTLKMVTNRSLSPLDYTLSVGNATGNCVSVVNNMESFICSPSVMYPSNKDYARMLFLIDQTQGPRQCVVQYDKSGQQASFGLQKYPGSRSAQVSFGTFLRRNYDLLRQYTIFAHYPRRDERSGLG